MYQYDAYKAVESGDLRLFWPLVERLPYEPYSVYRAEEAGGMEHFGWTVAAYQTTAVGDLIQINTNVTQVAGTRKRPKKITPLPRPEIKARTSKPESLTDINWGFFR